MSFVDSDSNGYVEVDISDFITLWEARGLPIKRIRRASGYSQTFVAFWLREVVEAIWRDQDVIGLKREPRLEACVTSTKAIYNNEELRVKWSSLVSLHKYLFREPEARNTYIAELLEDIKGELCTQTFPDGSI